MVAIMTDVDSAATAPAPQIPGYVYSRPLGRGGYADVYLYQEQRPRRPVAVKILTDITLSDAAREQFTAEADAMAAIADHPNVVPVFKTDLTSDGRPYIAMMYCPLDNLAVQASKQIFSVERVIGIGIQIASAVHTAHVAGMLHRDIKPANILTDQYGAPRLTDFGIAAQIALLDEDDDAGVSVPWSPPEVLYATAAPTVQSDVYSLAATMWHLLVGRAPYEVAGGDNSHFALMRRARDLPTPTTGRGDMPASLERLLHQAMSRTVTNRPASALDLARALQAIEQELRLPRTQIVVLEDTATGGGRALARTQAAQPTRAKAPLQPIAVARSVSKTVRRSGTADSTASEKSVVSAPDGGAEPSILQTSPAEQPATTAPRRRAIQLTIVVVIALVAASIWTIDQHGAGTPTVTPTPQADAMDQPSALEADLPPGPPHIVAQRLSATTVRFTWTYDSALSDDAFVPLLNGRQLPSQHGALLDTEVTAGSPACLQLEIRRADGSHAPLEFLPRQGVCVS